MVLRYVNSSLYQFYKRMCNNLIGLKKQKLVLDTVYQCLKEYEKNLVNKEIMFIAENKSRHLSKEIAYFPKSAYQHLTGVTIASRGNDKKLNSYQFYNLLKKVTITTDKYIIEEKDKTTNLKLEILPHLMQIDKLAKIIGDFSNYNILLQTEKIVGNINACMGFGKDKKTNMYIPNTVLKKDIRDITDNRSNIVAIFKKDIRENQYKNITYLKLSYQLNDILKNEEINRLIDIDNVYSIDKTIQNKILIYNQNSEKCRL